MREENRAVPRVRVQACQDVLEEGVIGAALRRRAPEVATPRVALPGSAVPLLDGVGRSAFCNAAPTWVGVSRTPFQWQCSGT